jgi:hypothetical protein
MRPQQLCFQSAYVFVKTKLRKDFYARTEVAILLLLIDTGMHRPETGGLGVQSPI